MWDEAGSAQHGGWAAEAKRLLMGPRGWGGHPRSAGLVDFKFVHSEEQHPHALVRLASNEDIMAQWPWSAAPIVQHTMSATDMAPTPPRRVMLNAARWRDGPAAAVMPSAQRDLEAYRTYLVNHELGHAMGLRHIWCTREEGAMHEPAPVMTQQTVSIRNGCAFNCEPTPRDVEALRRSIAQGFELAWGGGGGDAAVTAIRADEVWGAALTPERDRMWAQFVHSLSTPCSAGAAPPSWGTAAPSTNGAGGALRH